MSDGFCGCGCGRKTNIATSDWPAQGHVKGQPKPYVRGHRKPKHPDFVIDEGGCWNWLGCADRAGYGKIYRDGRRTTAHRWYYERHVGNIPDGHEVDHLCGNRICVNPAHLRAIPISENRRYKKSTKLSVEAATDIRSRVANGESMSAVARSLDVSLSTVSRVVHFRTWS